MSSIGKVFVILNLVFSLVVLGVVAAILAKSEEYKKKHDEQVTIYKTDSTKWTQEKSNFEAQAQNLNADKTRLDGEVADLNTRVTTLTGDKERLDTDNNSLRQDISKLKDDFAKFTDTHERVVAENTALRTENTEMRDAKNAAVDKQRAAEQDLARCKKDVETLNSKVAQFEAQITELEAQKGELAAQIEAAIQTGFDISKVRAQPKIDAVVQSVNEQMNMVILSVGADDGVSRGMKFAIHSNGQYKGEVVVVDVYPDNCSARIVPSATGKMMAASIADKASTQL